MFLSISHLYQLRLSSIDIFSLKYTNILFFYIYISGLPKPAIVTHHKTHQGGWLYNYCDATADDILYEPLPLYHSAASLIGVGAVVQNGLCEA